MKHINIFVAGSKDLMDYRQRLVLWANHNNYKYRQLNKPVQLNIYSFKEVGDDQDTYNKVITEISDIVLFLIEGPIGEKTKEELMKAKEGFNHNQHPLILVFTNNANASSKAYLEGAMGREYSIDFDSADDLINKVNDRIERLVENLGLTEDDAPTRVPEEAAVPKTNKASMVSGNRTKTLFLTSLIAICMFIIGWFMSQFNGNSQASTHTDSSPMLLIAGGGSVANYIEEQPGTAIPKLADYPNGYFVHLPTKSAWKMLVEEVVSLQDARRYYPICLSATEATDEDLCSAQISQQMFLDSAIVISAKLGEDPLAVYVQKNSKFFEDNPECLLNKSISVELLKKTILSKEINVYSTSKESGTLEGFCKALNLDSSQLEEYLAGQFSEHSPLSAVSVGNKPYLLLGSKYYCMNEVKNDAVQLTVQSDYVKPMMIYFMAYRGTSGDTYKIPLETIEFLNHLNLHTLDNYISPDGSIKIKNHNHVIYDERNLIEKPSK